VNETGTDSNERTTVTFRDLRFIYSSGLLSGRIPLMGTVYINSDRRVDRMEMDGHPQD
jgi:inner membrane protein